MDFQSIIAGMTGQQFMDAVNGNFNLTKEQMNKLAQNILLRVIANNVKQIKVEDGKFYYTLDDTTWKTVDNNVWGSITGDLKDQKDLQTILSDKASTKSVADVSKSVTDLSNEISGVKTTVGTNTNNISQNTKAIGDLQKSNATKVSSPTIVAFRISSSGFLQYSLDNVAWNNVQSIADINWGSIGGEISNQQDLKTILDSKVKQSDLDSHKNNKENPHSVTKEQIGLSEVDNTSDEDKPISTAQKEEFDKIKESIQKITESKLNVTEDITSIEYITLSDYNTKKDAGQLSDTTIYIVD